MTRAVALLRGINVGKAKRIAMADLRSTFEDLGLTDVKTVLQSGNVVFTTTDARIQTPGALATEITAAVEARTGVTAAALVVAGPDVKMIAAANPLVDTSTNDSRLIVTFLERPPQGHAVGIPDPDELAPEVLVVGERAIYQWVPDGVLASRVPAAFWAQFGPGLTARNWRTVNRLVDLVG